MKKKLITLIIFLLLVTSGNIHGESKKNILIMVEGMSIEDFIDLGADEGYLGFINIRTRKPYTRENLYRSINLGRKIGKKDLYSKKYEYFSDAYKGKILSLGEDSNLLFGDENGNVDLYLGDESYYDLSGFDLVAISLNLDSRKEKVDLKNFIEANKMNEILVVSTKVAKEDKDPVNDYLVPLIYYKDGGRGHIKSPSTNRKGYIVMEDISTSLIKDGKFKEKRIGNIIEVVPEEIDLRQMYKNNINLLYISYIVHGIVYASIFLSTYIIYKKSSFRKVYKYFLFGLNTISLSFVFSLLGLYENIYLYLTSLLIVAGLLTLIFKNVGWYFKFLILFNYLFIGLALIYKPDYIYHSYIGFNNLDYGARYYGLNNGIMGLFLGIGSILIIENEKSIRNLFLRLGLNSLVLVFNLLVLSVKYGANTGGFITGISLVCLYIYYMINGDNYKKWLPILILLGLIIFGLNMYIGRIDGYNHGYKMFERIRQNGLSEFYYIVWFKLKELVKMTLSPQYLLIFLSEIYILRKMRSIFKDKRNKIPILMGILGFFINDTGNVMLIYILFISIVYYIQSEYKYSNWIF